MAKRTLGLKKFMQQLDSLIKTEKGARCHQLAGEGAGQGNRCLRVQKEGGGHEGGGKGVPQAEAEEGLGQVPAAGMSPLLHQLGWGHSPDWRS